MMKRREFITLLGGAALAWPLAAHAQQAGMRRVGVLIALAESDPEGQLRIAALRRGLQQLGWFEGRNIQIDDRWQSGDAERCRASAAELMGRGADVVFAGNRRPCSRSNRQVTARPLYSCKSLSPLRLGLLQAWPDPATT